MKKIAEKIVNSPDLSILKDEHINKWVALSMDKKKLLAVADSLSALLEKARFSGEKVVIKVLPDLGYAPVGYK